MRFYFDIHEHTDVSRDDAGLDFATMDEAIGEARRTLASVGSEAIARGLPWVSVEVRNGTGQVMATLTASVQVNIRTPLRSVR